MTDWDDGPEEGPDAERCPRCGTLLTSVEVGRAGSGRTVACCPRCSWPEGESRAEPETTTYGHLYGRR